MLGAGLLVGDVHGVRFWVWLTEWVGYAEGVAVCFDEVATFDVRDEVEVVDQGAGLG